MRVHLLTQVNSNGACGLVHEAEIPAFLIPPRVLFWGTRVFVRDEVAPYENAYVEAFGYWLPVVAPNAPSGERP